jgi:hypothetical protein
MMNAIVKKIGFLSGILAFTATIAFYAVQLLKLFGLLLHPFNKFMIYGFSNCITLPFIFKILALNNVAPLYKKF